jgi:hypothetical protein
LYLYFFTYKSSYFKQKIFNYKKKVFTLRALPDLNWDHPNWQLGTLPIKLRALILLLYLGLINIIIKIMIVNIQLRLITKNKKKN